MSDICTHLDQILVTDMPASVKGCEDCLRIGGNWLHPSDLDRRLVGRDENEDQVGWLDGAISRRPRLHGTHRPAWLAADIARNNARTRDRLAKQRGLFAGVVGLARITERLGDAAVEAAGSVLLAVPSQLGVEYNAEMLDTIARKVAPAFGWKPESTESESASRNLS